MNARRWLAPFLISACAPGERAEPPSRPSIPPPASTPIAAPQPSTSGDSQSAEVPQLPSRSSIARAPLRLVASQPFVKKPLPKPRRLATGAVALPGIPGPDRVVVETLQHRGVLLDARAGRKIAEFAAPLSVSPAANAIVLDTKQPELVRLSDAKHVAAKLDPEASDIASRSLVADGRHARTIMLIESTSGEKRIALPKDEKLETFVARPLPLPPSKDALAAIPSDDLTWHFVIRNQGEGGTPWFLPHGRACMRAQLGEKDEPRCIEYEPRLGFGGSPRWLADGWVVTDQYIAHQSWGGQRTQFAGLVGTGHCNAMLTIAAPPRAFVMCDESSGLIAPDAVLSLDRLPHKHIGGLLGADAGPIVPLLDTKDASDTTEIWLDLPKKRVWQTPVLHPLAIAGFAGVGTRALAETSDKQVFVLDFEQGTRELVAKVHDCPGVLGEIRELWDVRARYLILSCLTPPPPDGVSQLHIWSEIVDLAARVRYRTTRLPEIIFDDGVVVLSTRRALAAETKAAPGEISSAELPKP